MSHETEETGHPLCPRCCRPYGEADEICEHCGYTVRTSPWNYFAYTLGVARPRQPCIGDPLPPFKALARVWSWGVALAITAIAMIITALNSGRDEWMPMFIAGAIALPVGLVIGAAIRHMVVR